MKVRRPGTTVEELYQTIRDHIINGRYHPGFRLSQQTLATELKVSRTPLREALSRLAAEGLVVGEANRGMEVAPVYNDHAEQSYGLRLLIEPPTIGALVDDISEQDVDQMQSVLEQMEQICEKPSHPGIPAGAFAISRSDAALLPRHFPRTHSVATHEDLPASAAILLTS